jgi:hypothetical protein
MTIVQKFNREIEGEKLLYINKDSYNKEEANLVFDAVANRMMHNLYYPTLILHYIQPLKSKILPQIDMVAKAKEFEAVADKLVSLQCRYKEDVLEEYDYGQYCVKENYGFSDSTTYCKAIVENVIDARELEQVLSSNTEVFSYRLNRNFLITANLMFARYPEFYNDEYVARLHYMIEHHKEKDITDKVERKNYKEAEKATIKQIKKYCKNRKKEKRMQKVKK